MEIPPGQKKFECEHCQAAILVPVDLPATSAPCPVCQMITTSPALGQAVAAAPQAVAAAPQRMERKSERDMGSRSKRKRSNESGRGAGLLWGVAGLVALSLVLGGIVLFIKSRPKPSQGNIAPMGVVESGEATIGAAVGVSDQSEGIRKRALEVLDKFLTASSVEEKAKYVLGKERLIPEMRAFYGSGVIEHNDLQADFFSEWAIDSPDAERGIYLLDFELPKQFRLSGLFRPITDFKTRLNLEAPDLHTSSKALVENFEMDAVRAMIFLKDTDGELLVDWHTYVQTKNRLFRDFVESPVAGGKGTFRLVIAEHVSTIFEQDSSTRNYKLIEPAHHEEDFTVVRVQRDSEVGKILEELAWTDVPGKRNLEPSSRKGATVVLEWSNEAEPVLGISRILCWEFLGVGGDPSNLTSSN